METADVNLKKILVATDLSDQAGLAIERAIELGKETGAEVIIAHVVDEALPENARSFLTTTSDHYIRSKLANLPHAEDVAVTIDIVTGRPDVDIAERAVLDNADCIVAGLHNRLLSENLAIEGTIGEQLIRATHKPVLLVKNKPRGPYKSIVVGVDFSAFSRAAFRAAALIAPRAAFHLVHAFHAGTQKSLFARLSDEETRSKLAAGDRARLETFIDAEMQTMRLLMNGVPSASRIECHSREGDAHSVLKAEAERLQADLIVVGTHARVGLQRSFLGSVSTNLINDRIADVMVVRPY